MTVRYLYTSPLGVVPAFAGRQTERRDEMLAHTGPAAREILRQLGHLSPSKKIHALDRVLGRFDPALPMRVRRVAAALSARGMHADMAVERALSLSLADAAIEKIKRMGVAAQRGESLLGALGSTASPTETQAEKNAGDVVAGMMQGVVCSNSLQTQVTNLVGRNEGADAAAATSVGFEVGQGVAMCPGATAPVPAPVPSTSTSDSGSSLAVPIAIGAGVLAVVGGAFLLMRKK